MPYKLRKAPKRELYWVVSKETGAKHSKEPLPKETAKKQMKALYASESGYKMRGGAREVRPNGAGGFAIMDGNQQVAGPYDTQEQAEIALLALENRDRIRASAERARRAMAAARARGEDPAPPRGDTPPRRQSSEDPTGGGIAPSRTAQVAPAQQPQRRRRRQRGVRNRVARAAARGVVNTVAALDRHLRQTSLPSMVGDLMSVPIGYAVGSMPDFHGMGRRVNRHISNPDGVFFDDLC